MAIKLEQVAPITERTLLMEKPLAELVDVILI
jgi:hypothetical protein